jgi:hypothetical protein
VRCDRTRSAWYDLMVGAWCAFEVDAWCAYLVDKFPAKSLGGKNVESRKSRLNKTLATPFRIKGVGASPERRLRRRDTKK